MKLKIFTTPTSTQTNLDFLEDSNFTLNTSFTTSQDRDSKQQAESIELSTEDVLGIELKDGTVWFAAEEDIEHLFELNRNRDRPNDEGILLPNYIINENERGIGKFIIKIFHFFKRKKKPIAKYSALKIAQKIEKKLEEGLKQVDKSFDLIPYAPEKIDKEQPILLLIHGTGSSTKGSFEDLIGTETWTNLYKKYQQNILAFDHKTLTKSPLQNTKELLETLPKNSHLHLVTSSRGGLIGDILCRCTAEQSEFTREEAQLLNELRTDQGDVLLDLNGLARKKQITVSQYIRIACPASGTPLLSKRLDHFFNVLLNIIPTTGFLALDLPIKALKNLVLATIEERNNPEILPGLESMRPNAPILNLLNHPKIENPTQIWIIAGHAGIGNFRKTLKCVLARLFYREDNDLIVNTDSMFMGGLSEHPRYYKFVKGAKVDHFSYFKNKDTRTALYNILGDRLPTEIPNDFKIIQHNQENRGVNIPGGIVKPTPITDLSRIKPLLVLLPGIMGSNLGKPDDEAWLDIPDLLTGGIFKLKIDKANIGAIGIVASAYEKLVNYAKEEEDWEVLVFPFDWRKSTKEAGERLADTLQLLMDRAPEQKIALMAHSMGGLVVRDLIFRHTTIWERLVKRPRFRCLLLGTPWKGAYAIPQLIVGKGKRIRSLNRLVYYESKKDLLKIFGQYPGLFELLPIDNKGIFEKKPFWELLENLTWFQNWHVPTKKVLDRFSIYRKQMATLVNQSFKGEEKVFYIAGKSEQTIDDLVFRIPNETIPIEEYPKVQKLYEGKKVRPRYDFISTEEGDGSVTWASGIPAQIPRDNVYYVETTHGELANVKDHFARFFELLITGNSFFLSREPIKVSESSGLFRGQSEVLSNDPAELAREVIGLSTFRRYQVEQSISLPPLKVQMINGDLRYNKRPVMIGHFEADGIVSAEKVMDLFLNGKLLEKRNLDIYPGALGTHLVYQSEKDNKAGVIIVGLGRPEELTPRWLSHTVEKACLGYMSSQEKATSEGYELSSLLIGSGYGNLSLTSSIQAILEGIIRANRKMATQYPANPIISSLSFIELYEEKANTAFAVLDTIKQATNLNFTLDYPLKSIDGKRSQLPIDDTRAWWNRFRLEVIDEAGKDYISILAANGKAGVGRQKVAYRPALIDNILQKQHKEGTWDKAANQTAFELMIPSNLKISLRSQPNIIWVLDKEMAKYPWELFQYDKEDGAPQCTKAGMIRQLSTSYLAKNINVVLSQTALIIGDPKLDGSDAYQLAGAAAEAKLVNDYLDDYGFDTDLSLKESAPSIMGKLFKDYKVIHIASHGVLNYGVDKKETGILLSNNFVITPETFALRTSTPELVFINCCHLGDIDDETEKFTRNKYQLAANIGTQLIEDGVRAVVVAGWPINDNAAKVFSSVFYENMLQGENFGTAVLRAREKCYRDYPHHNTWGAYQCYGDPFYQLKNNPRKTALVRPYILEKEALIDLEILANKADSSLSREENVGTQLQRVSNRIKQSKFKNSLTLLEKEASVYAQANLLAKAIERYEKLFRLEKANYSVKSLENYCNIKMKYFLQEELYDDQQIKEVLQKLQSLVIFGENSERLALVGSFYKRHSMLLKCNSRLPRPKPAPSRKEVLLTMTAEYKAASLLAFKKGNGYAPLSLEDGLGIKVYWIENWLTGERLLKEVLTAKAYSARAKKLISILPTDTVLEFLDKKLDKLAEKNNDEKEFWDFIETVNIYQCYLLYCEDPKKYGELVANIKKDYDLAWQRGGTFNNLESEQTQMRFMIDNLSVNSTNAKLVEYLSDLEQYFKDKK